MNEGGEREGEREGREGRVVSHVTHFGRSCNYLVLSCDSLWLVT